MKIKNTQTETTFIQTNQESIYEFFKDLDKIFEDVQNFEGDWEHYSEYFGYDVDVNQICKNLINTLLESNGLYIKEIADLNYMQKTLLI
jgi:hypothetical protein